MLKKYSFLLLKLITALILLQTLYFKFSSAEESVYIFSRVGMEPWGRIASGVAELLAGILLLTRTKDWLGALISLVVISGAIFFHLTSLGIEIMNDGGQLFGLALIVFVFSLIILIIRHKSIPIINRFLK
ncbi:MAG: DoxX family protein [Flavobacteriales bacterium]|nr:DoxX family protein [Flavobacteriales bacterium]